MKDYNWIWKLALVLLLAYIVIHQNVGFDNIAKRAVDIVKGVKK